MQVDTLQFLNRFLGIPLCWIFTLVRRIARLVRAKQFLPTPQRVLVIKPSEMGSSVLAYPALTELKKRCSEVELFFLVFENNAPIIEVLGLTPPSRIITADYSSTLRLLSTGVLALRRLLAERIDTTIDMDFFSCYPFPSSIF